MGYLKDVVTLGIFTLYFGVNQGCISLVTDKSDNSGSKNDQQDSQGEPKTYVLDGIVQKGPFVVGSSVDISLAWEDGQIQGVQTQTWTKNNLGSFSAEFISVVKYIFMEAEGFYYDEITGSLSAAPITLRSYYVLRDVGNNRPSINVFTHLTHTRIKKLAKDLKLSEAIATAEAELITALPITLSGFNPGVEGTDMSILGGDTAANQYLFALSAILMQATHMKDGPIDATLQEFINTLAADFAEDGEFTFEHQAILVAALQSLDTADVMNKMVRRIQALDSNAEVPNLDQILDQDFDGQVNAEDCLPLDPLRWTGHADLDGDGYIAETCGGDDCNDDCVMCFPGGLFDCDMPAIVVQLTWDNPAADQDLHLLNLDDENAQLCGSLECLWRNRAPIWFEDYPEANPILDNDVIQGTGPETIRIQFPMPGTYRIVTHYFPSFYGDAGSVNQNLSLVINSEVGFSYTKELSFSGIWNVADIMVDEQGNVVQVQEIEDDSNCSLAVCPYVVCEPLPPQPPPVPETWTCPEQYYNAQDGCDCNCGAYDPDCNNYSDDDLYGCDGIESPYCTNEGVCESSCSCGGAMCGDDGCGNSCGECQADDVCFLSICVPNMAFPPYPGDLMINEILADPPIGVDVNGDGIANTSSDEFIEIANVSYNFISLDGVSIADQTTYQNGDVRMTFPDGYVLQPGEVIAVFGSYAPLMLNNDGDVVYILSEGSVISSVGYGVLGGHDVSLNRERDLDPEAPMVLHTDLNPFLPYSPGTQVDGSDF